MTPLEQLVAAFGRNDVVVIVGTGVTAAATNRSPVSSWAGLLSDGVGRLESLSRERSALAALNLEHAESPSDFADVAGKVRRELGDHFGRWLAMSVGRLKVQDPRLINAIGDLGVPILTTNYDDLIERQLGRNSATWKTPHEMLRLLREDTGTVGHLHGVWTFPESVVFSSEDYSRITNDSEAQNVQQAAFRMKSFLFVGVGDGITDPNFDPMVKDFSQLAQTSAGTHFRLCLTHEVDPASELRSIVDVGFGDRHDDLPAFIQRLCDTIKTNGVDLQRRSRERLLDLSRENSTMWRESDVLNEKTFSELVVAPTFLPEPHDQFATSVVNNAERNRPEPVSIDPILVNGGLVMIAGDENSGVTTAIHYCLNRSMDLRSQSHAILVDKPISAARKRVENHVRTTYRDWGVETAPGSYLQGLILGIDNLRFDESPQFERAIDSIRDVDSSLKIIGVRQNDVASIIETMKKSGISDDIQVVYVGRFSNLEALELARRIAPDSSERVATNVMIIIRQKNLPRTPFTMTLLIELILSGTALGEEESELAVLDKYLDLLLRSEFLKSERDLKMNLRNKRKILELLAQHFVERKEDHVPESDLLGWLGVNFGELGWSHSPTMCLNDLIARRVLSRRAGGSIGFQRSTYLELMAGNSAKADANFREKVLAAPIALASVVRTYAAMTRDSERVLEVVEDLLDGLPVVEVKGRVFGEVKKIAPSPDRDTLSERSVPEVTATPATEVDAELEPVRNANDTHPIYDNSDDSDTPAFLLTRVEDLPPWRLLMLAADLSSRVLRDSDEVRNQDMKERLLRKVLATWVEFAELYEREVTESEELDDLITSFLEEEGEKKEVELRRLRRFFNVLLPSVLTSSGIQYCLSGPSLVARLSSMDFDGNLHGENAALMRTVALYGATGKAWIESLSDIGASGLKSFFCSTYIAGLARYAYVTDEALSDDELQKIREFLRRIITERYVFSSIEERNRVTNKFEDNLSRKRLNHSQQAKRRELVA